MKLLLSFFILTCCFQFNLLGQPPVHFEAQVNEFIPGTYRNSVAYEDMNGNGYIDLLVCGYSTENTPITELYKNDGNGNYSLVFDTSFENVISGSVTIFDFDGDGKEDVLLTGFNSNHQRIAKLYKNLGDYEFSEVPNTIFTPINFSDAAAADVNGDGKLDLLLSGYADNNERITELYINNGNGDFTLSSASFVGVSSGTVNFADVNNDNYPDVFITGEKEDEQAISQLYINDGSGNFTLSTSSNFEKVYNSVVAFGDVDNDGNVDLVLSGQKNYSQTVSQLYKNDGNGNFTLSKNFTGTKYGSLAFADINGDGNLDLLNTGYNSYDMVSELLINDGNGNFSVVEDSKILPVQEGFAVFIDVNNDGDEELLISGKLKGIGTTSILYENDGNGNFSDKSSMFLGVKGTPQVAFSDFNGDGHLDVLIIGRDPLNNSNGITALYLNDGTGKFVEKENTNLSDMEGIFAVADIDGDGDMDVLISGKSYADNYQNRTKLYKNNGDGEFTEVTGTPFLNTAYNSIIFGDVDGNGTQDVLVTGTNSSPLTKLYLNDGNGNFTLSSQSFEQVTLSMATFADLTGDGSLDIVIAGSPSSAGYGFTKLYFNDGAGNFTESTEDYFEGFDSGSVVAFDADGDGDLDLLFSGKNSYSSELTQLYINDGSGAFTLDTENNFPPLFSSKIAVVDVNNDGFQDFLLTGLYDNPINPSFTLMTNLYLNDGTGKFIQYNDVPFMNIDRPGFAFADVDADGDQDLIMAGGGQTVLYKNITCFTPFEVGIIVEGTELTADVPNAIYDWVDCDQSFQSTGVTTQTFTPEKNGNYAVKATAYGGCTAMSECVKFNTLGIENETLDNINVYPNPTRSTLEISSDIPIKEYSIYSMDGKLIRNEMLTNSSIDVQVLKSGIYLLHLKNKQNDVIFKKFVKE